MSRTTTAITRPRSTHEPQARSFHARKVKASATVGNSIVPDILVTAARPMITPSIRVRDQWAPGVSSVNSTAISHNAIVLSRMIRLSLFTDALMNSTMGLNATSAAASRGSHSRDGVSVRASR